ncbi:MAG: HD-GYP domain-containing protein [Acetatifactor sp.]
MEVLQWCKMQIPCLLILGYVGVNYIREGRQLKRVSNKTYNNPIFNVMFVLSVMAVLFDGITACTVNFTDKVPRVVNLVLHLGMFLPYEAYIVMVFLYWLQATVGVTKKKWIWISSLFGAVMGILTIVLIPQLEFLEGEYTNYSMGLPVYACFACIGIYFVMTLTIIVINHRNIAVKKKIGVAITLVFILLIVMLQIIFPEILISCIAITMVTIGIYISMENPTISSLEYYQDEMVTGFSTLVENKDDNTGGHIRRSSAYAYLIANNLRKEKKYRNVINRDFLNNLLKAAPMHDIGKVGIPDAILQKRGKLTETEYEKMKEHPRIGGKIIRDTFGHLFDGEYENMAYQVAMYHHEKWNGKGYPEGRSGEDIPLCARIMAVADVFDAVSEKRCYRDALPLEECYRIIRDGRGVDFDPDVVDAFFLRQDLIEEIYEKNKNSVL